MVRCSWVVLLAMLFAVGCAAEGAPPASRDVITSSVAAAAETASRPARLADRPTPEVTVSRSKPARDRPSPTVRYAFPIRPAGVARYGRSHHDYPATDIFAPCGAAVVSPVDGTVEDVSRSDHWAPGSDTGATRGGRYVTVVGVDGVRYYGSHLSSVRPGLRRGNPVHTGQRLGRVGRSGNARTTPCHLHFGISPPTHAGDWRVRRGVIWPWRYLDAWRVGRQRSPVSAISTWTGDHR